MFWFIVVGAVLLLGLWGFVYDRRRGVPGKPVDGSHPAYQDPMIEAEVQARRERNSPYGGV